MKKVLLIVAVALLLGTMGKGAKKEPSPHSQNIPPGENQDEKPPEQPVPSAKVSEARNLTYLLKDDGGRIDWSGKNRLLLFDKPNENQYFRLWTMNADGSGQNCLTCDSALLPDRHHGNPAWHPGGEFIVFQASDPGLAGLFGGTGLYKLYTNPGAGVQNNIWIINKNASRAWQVTSVARNGGVLHPHFSPDGTRLVWAERISGGIGIGSWVIKLADIKLGPGDIEVKNIRELKPGNLQWYETHGFSRDSSTLIFSGMKTGGSEKDFDIFTYHLDSGTLRQLTDSRLEQWDEHAHFLPNSTQILWMSSMGITQKAASINQFKVKTDYWIMNADGSGKRRLTFFNNQNSPHRVIAADVSITDDGKYLFGYIQDPGSMEKPGSIIRYELK